MPELPEVETTRLGIEPYLTNSQISHVVVRHFTLRWRIDKNLATILSGQTIYNIKRRAKYLLLHCDNGTLIIHLGMSGSLRIINKNNAEAGKHDHVDITFNNGYTLRYNDPRRFGAILWTTDSYKKHKLLAHLGVEPLTSALNGDYLYKQSRARTCSIKTLIMNSKIVVGIGNIYANESLFLAGIYPKTSAKKLSRARCITLASAIKTILKQAIKAGGTTLKDFSQSDGKPGYFTGALKVYGRKDEPCLKCKQGKIQHYKEVGRASFYCPVCQKN